MIRAERLGEILCRKGLITQAQLAHALRKQGQLQEERRLLEELAGPVPVEPVSRLGQILVRMGAVSRPRLEEALRSQDPRRAPSRWERALAAAAALGEAGGLEEVQRRILPAALEAVEGVAGALALLDRPGGRVCFCLGCGPLARRLAPAERLGRGGLIGRVLRGGESVLIPLMGEPPARGSPPAAARAGTGLARLVPQFRALGGFAPRSALCVPLLCPAEPCRAAVPAGRPEPLGALLVLDRAAGGPFTPQDAVLLGIFAGLCSLALRRARPVPALRLPGETDRRMIDDSDGRSHPGQHDGPDTGTWSPAG